MYRGSRKSVAGVALAGMLVMVMTALAPAQDAHAAAAVVVVSEAPGGTCGSYPPSVTNSISAAVGLLPASGGTVVVCPGLYDAFLLNNIPGKVTIKAALNDTDNLPIVRPSTGASGSVIQIQDSNYVALAGLFITASTFSSPLSGDVAGVTYVNSSGAIQNNTIAGVYNLSGFGTGMIRGHGVEISDSDGNNKASVVTIKNNTFREIDGSMITADGNAKVITSGNYLIASTTVTKMGHAGISYSLGATGSITGNQISQTDFGILLSGASKVSVSKNIITIADTGIYISAGCGTGANLASANKIASNVILKANYGIDIFSDGTGGCLPHADSISVAGNTVGGNALTGVGLRIREANGGTALKAKFSGNIVYAFSVFNFLGATGTSFTKNTFVP